jgi:hypothetical protein
MRRFLSVLLVASGVGIGVGAAAEAPRYDPMFALSLVDAPFNFQGGYFVPTAAQALDLTQDFFEGSYWGIAVLSDLFVPRERTILNRGLRYLASVPLVWFGTELPVPFGTWLHEQYHVAALRYGGVPSRNGNSFLRWDGTVYGISDADLIELKEEDPAALVRAHAAGLEANNHLVLSSVQQDFYDREAVSKPFLYLYYAYYNWNYFRLSIGELGDEVTQAILDHEGAVAEERDFTGLDPLAWVYDLFRPEEPYSARGPHPTGVGIKRPIAWSDLTGEEQAFLERQQLLSLVNLANPFAFFVHHLGGEGWRMNLMAQHTLTSFGYTVDLNVFLRLGELGLFVSQKNQWNRYRYFPGLELQAADLRLSPWLALTPRLILWLQPEDQTFSTRTAQAGLLVSAQARAKLSPVFGAFGELGYKTEGWVMGNMYLGPTLFGRAGVTARL